MRHTSIALAAVVAAACFGCGGSSGTELPPDTLDHDASALFAGRWSGSATLAVTGQTQAGAGEMDVNATGRNTLLFPGLCQDGDGPIARVTSDTELTVASHGCSIPIPSGSCTLTWRIQGGHGALADGKLQLSMNGPATGCNLPPRTTMSLTFAGTKQAAFFVSFLDPASADAGGPAFTLRVNGTGFPADAVVQWNGSPRPTTFVSGSLVQAQIPASDLTSGGTALVTVRSPAAGTTSFAATFQIVGATAPSIFFLSPPSVVAGGGALTLQVNGTGFRSDAVVQWNGSPRATTFFGSNLVQAQIPASDVASIGTAQVTVSSASAGWTSPATTFQIVGPPPPMLYFISPSSAVAGSGGLTLQVTGSAFTSASVVLWNGSPRATTFVHSGSLQAQILAADLAAAGTAQVTVREGTDGTPSSAVAFEVFAPQSGVTILSLPVRDMVWDPVRQKIYVSLNNSSPTNPNTITTVDPFSGTFDAGAFAGSQPNRLAISDDGQFLYAGIDGAASVERFTLPGLAQDLKIPLGSDPFFGSFHAGDVQVAPGAPHTVAVSLAVSGVSPSAQGGVVVFDDAVARATRVPGFGGTPFSLLDSLQWGADATALYASNTETTGADFYVLAVNASGVTLAHDYAGALGGFNDKIHFDPVTRLVYSDDGRAVDPATGLQAGIYGVSGPMIPDGDAGVAVFVTNDFSSSGLTVRTFDLTRFTSVKTFVVQRVTGQPTGRVLRWGTDGIAFATTDGQLVLTHYPHP